MILFPHMSAEISKGMGRNAEEIQRPVLTESIWQPTRKGGDHGLDAVCTLGQADSSRSFKKDPWDGIFTHLHGHWAVRVTEKKGT